ncbi:HlyD family secretion protein [Serratia sp. NA_112.1]|uniref:HlyD family secretion protein n=1 Tax=unclassified Serratia (in: enterobacteria) TaxID=2647522 RepID=UPI004046B317
MGLFRKEAVDYKNSKWKGKALLISGVKPIFLLLISLFFLIILIFFLKFGDYTRRINVAGEVTTLPRNINIFASQQGFISKKFVSPGDIVKKGQPLYKIDVSRVTESGRLSVNTQEAIEKQLEQNRSIIEKLQSNKEKTLENLTKKKQQYEKSQKQSKALVEDARKGVEDARKTMQSYLGYQQRGLITRDQLSSQRYSYYQLQSSFQNLYSQQIQEELQITSLTNEYAIQAADFDNRILQYRSQNSDLQKQLMEAGASGELVIIAPTDGQIESLSVTSGQMVNAGDSLAQLSPSGNSTYYLILWLPNNSVPYISKGDSVNIRYDAFPFEKYGQFHGEVYSIAYVPASLQEMATYGNNPISQAKSTESYYKVLISIDKNIFKFQNEEFRITNGMNAQATLFLETRPLYQWMFSPFYKMKNSVMGPINE